MERLKSSLRKFYGRYGDLIKQHEVSLSQMLHYIKYANLLPNWTLIPILTLLPNFGGFHRNIATGAASQQRTLTPPNTWSCPIWDFAFVLMLRPFFPELVIYMDLLSFEHPSVLLFFLRSNRNRP